MIRKDRPSAVSWKSYEAFAVLLKLTPKTGSPCLVKMADHGIHITDRNGITWFQASIIKDDEVIIDSGWFSIQPETEEQMGDLIFGRRH